MKKMYVSALLATALLPTTALADWTGWYGGLSAGSSTNNEFTITSGVGADIDLDDSNNFGGFAGFLTQNGSVVYGGEVAISNFSDLGGTVATGFDLELDGLVFDFRARAGVTFGDVLAYGVFGISSYAFANDLFDDFEQSGFNYGAGIEYQVNDNLFFGAEYLSRQIDGTTPVGTEFQVTHESIVNSIGLRAGFKF